VDPGQGRSLSRGLDGVPWRARRLGHEVGCFGKMGHMSGFRAFLLRGNVVDLAVGIVVGAAFTAVVQAFVRDLLTPLIAAVVGRPDFSALSFAVNRSIFRYGDFVDAIVVFVIVAAVVYYLVVLPYTSLRARFDPPPQPATPTKRCPECLSEIPAAARRCAFCTSAQTVEAA
jgi:large conductance mechanosensitive channel